MLNQGVAEANPELGIAGIATHCILQDSDSIRTVPVPGQCLGNAEPRLGGGKITKEGVASLGQREDFSSFTA